MVWLQQRMEKGRLPHESLTDMWRDLDWLVGEVDAGPRRRRSRGEGREAPPASGKWNCDATEKLP